MSTTTVKGVEITIQGDSASEPGVLSQVIIETFAMARDGRSGTFKVNGIRADVKVTP